MMQKAEELAGGWLAKLDLTDDISPSDIEICKNADGEDWKLGEGAFGTASRLIAAFYEPSAMHAFKGQRLRQPQYIEQRSLI